MEDFFKKFYDNYKVKHIAIIMDGNRRWAKLRGMPSTAGHLQGAKNFREIVLHLSKNQLKVLTVYAFSTENWNRPKLEVDFLINLFKNQLRKALSDFYDENVKVNFLGSMEKFPKQLVSLINEVIDVSKSNTGMVLNVALNYGGRAEILRAARNLAFDYSSKKVDVSTISEDIFCKYLYTKDQPDPDLVIRTGGEVRVSNFLLWQSAYSEYFFTKTLWPDFSEIELNSILEDYTKRKRRYGR